jgi:hypothetical protein
MTRYVILLSSMLLASSAAGAQSFAYMYDMRKLQQEKPRYEQRIGELYGRITALLTEPERSALAGVRIECPLIGAQSGTPVDFYTMGHVRSATVFMPVLSLLFLEDLATTFAWLQHHDHSLEPIEAYVTLLRSKKVADFPGGRYPAPLKALRIPPDALSDASVEALARAWRDEAYVFILLHEFGHALSRYPRVSGAPAEVTGKHEEEADRFALTVLERADPMPMGVVLWLMAQANAMPHKGQLMAEGVVKSEADWQMYAKTWASHPFTADRLSAIALHLDGWATRAGHGQPRDVLTSRAARLAYIAQGFHDPESQGCDAGAASRSDLAALEPRRTGATDYGGLMQAPCEKKP